VAKKLEKAIFLLGPVAFVLEQYNATNDARIRKDSTYRR
jgi:hypothetical protein